MTHSTSSVSATARIGIQDDLTTLTLTRSGAHAAAVFKGHLFLSIRPQTCDPWARTCHILWIQARRAEALGMKDCDTAEAVGMCGLHLRPEAQATMMISKNDGKRWFPLGNVFIMV